MKREPIIDLMVFIVLTMQSVVSFRKYQRELRHRDFWFGILFSMFAGMNIIFLIHDL